MAKKRTQEVKEADITQEMQEEGQSKVVQEETTVEEGHAFKYVQDYLNKDLAPLNKEDAAALLETMRKSDIMKPFFALMEEYPEEISVLMELQKIPDRVKKIPLPIFLDCVRESANDMRISPPDLLKMLFNGKWGIDEYPTIKRYREIIERAENWQDIKKENKSAEILAPNYHALLNTKIAHALAGRGSESEFIKLINAPADNEGNNGAFISTGIKKKGEQMEITDYVSFSDGGDNAPKLARALTPLQENISNAIMTIYDCAKERSVSPVFTVASLYGNMPGKNGDPSPQMEKEIRKTIKMFEQLDVKIDATEHFIQRNIIPSNGSWEVEEKYLRLRKHTINAGAGHKVDAWEIIIEPVLYTHAYLTKQIITINKKFLDIEEIGNDGKLTGKGILINETRGALLIDLARRIKIMQNDIEEAKSKRKYAIVKNKKETGYMPKPLESYRIQSDIIVLDNLFKRCQIEKTSRVQENRNKDFVLLVLDNWKIKGFIKDYEKIYEGRGGAFKKVLIRHKL